MQAAGAAAGAGNGSAAGSSGGGRSSGSGGGSGKVQVSFEFWVHRRTVPTAALADSRHALRVDAVSHCASFESQSCLTCSMCTPPFPPASFDHSPALPPFICRQITYCFRAPSSLRPVFGEAGARDKDRLYSEAEVAEALAVYAAAQGGLGCGWREGWAHAC